ncbi:MAG TPA: hypothetical protein VLF68_00165 [Candidatus Saccharimonadales bacterium]|nr:hypothetical protein [Candidatus Saccharimonadales bacterium]
MRQRHPQSTGKGKQTNIMKNAYLAHSKKHETLKGERVDLLPEYKKHSG